MTSARPAAALRALESVPARAADFAVQLYKKAAEDDVLFLAGGVAFNILLAGVPFFLLLASGLGYALGKSEAASSGAVAAFITDLFPDTWSGKGSMLDPIIRDIVRKIDLNEYKRKQAPPCLRVTTKAFGIGRRVPIAQRYIER